MPDVVDGVRASLAAGNITGGRIGLELGYGQRVGMCQNDFEALKRVPSPFELVDASGIIWSLRTRKSPLEVDALRTACEATSRAFEQCFRRLKPGMTENGLAGLFFAELSLTNYNPGFMMVRSGVEKCGMINVCPFDKPMQLGDMVVADAGATFKDYWCDMMRMAVLGKPTPE